MRAGWPTYTRKVFLIQTGNAAYAGARRSTPAAQTLRYAGATRLPEPMDTQPEPSPPQATTWRETAPDGGRFGVTRILPAGPVRATAVLVPGMFTGRRFWLSDKGVGLAAYLAEAGIAGLIVERRGIGDGRDDPGPARPGLQEHLSEDLPMVQRIAQGLHPGPVFWIGHSFGGVLAARAAGMVLDADEVAGLVLFATQFEVDKTMLDYPANLLTRGLSRMLGRFPASWVGLGPEDEPVAAMNDACALVAEGRRRPGLKAVLGRARAPTLAVVGGGDTVDPPSGCRRFVEHLGGDDKTFLCAGTETGFSTDFDHPGIVISKPAQTEVWPRVRAWIEARLP